MSMFKLKDVLNSLYNNKEGIYMLKFRISKSSANIFLLYVIIAWYMVPIVSSKLGTMGLVVIVAFWVLTCNFKNWIKSLRGMISFFYWYIYMLLMFIVGLYMDTGVTPIYFFTMTAVTVFPACIYSYYTKEIADNKIDKLKNYIVLL